MNFVSSFLGILREGDLFPLVAAVFLALIFAGQSIGREPTLRLRGHAVGLIAAVLWAICVLVSGTIRTASDFLWDVVVRGALVGGLVTAMAWVVLIGFEFLFPENTRTRTRELIQQLHWPRKKPHGYLEYHEAQEEEIEAEAEIEEEPEDRGPQEREEMLFELKLFYDRHCDVLLTAFPESNLKKLRKTFLHDGLDVDSFRSRVEDVKSLLQARIDNAVDSERAGFETVEDAVSHFQAERERILQMDLDEETLESLLVSFDEARDMALEEFIKGFNKRRPS